MSKPCAIFISLGRIWYGEGYQKWIFNGNRSIRELIELVRVGIVVPALDGESVKLRRRGAMGSTTENRAVKNAVNGIQARCVH